MPAFTNVLDHLESEWHDLSATGAFAQEFDRFVAQHPELARLSQDCTGGLAGEHADAVFHALLTEHHSGSYLAGRLVLQCMIPTMRKMVIRSAARYADHDDAAQQAVTAMWQEISEFDLARTQKVAATLNGRTLTRVCGDKAPDVHGRRRSRNTHLIDEVPMDTQTLVVLAASTPDPADEFFSTAARILGPIGEVLEVIAWGLDVKALTAEDAALLAKVYAPDARDTPRPGGRSLQLHVAQELGISHAALRKRAERAVRRLASAVLEWS